MPNAIQVGEHQFILPPAPLSQDEVLFSKELPRNQYWRRQKDFPKFFYDWNAETRMEADLTFYSSTGVLLSLSREDSKTHRRLRDRELQRRVTGVWFMNNGELTYLTGGHYFILQWGAMKGYSNPRDEGSHFGQYREFQRDVAYFVKLVKDDDQCIGGDIVKPKKTGITQFMMLDILDESTRVKGKEFGIMSKVYDDCKHINFRYFSYGLQNLPNALKPSIQNLTQSSVYFGDPNAGKNASIKSLSRAGNNNFLDTHVVAHSTSPKAFDGAKYYRALISEFPKLTTTAYPYETYEPTAAAVKMQDEIIGKLFLESYVPEEDDESCDQARKIYYESKLKTKRGGARTVSGMYCYSISVIDSAEGSFDIYGKANKEKNWLFVKTGYDKFKNDSNKLQGFKRQNPTCEDDSWTEGGGEGAIFDNLRLGIKKKELEEEQIMGALPFVAGELKWRVPPTLVEDPDPRESGKILQINGEVYFEPASDKDIMAGKLDEFPFRMFELDLIDEGKFNLPFRANLRHKKNKLLKPDYMGTNFFSGLDNTNYAMKKHVVTGSNNALYVMNFPDAYENSLRGRYCTNRIVLEYIYRREKPDDTLMDVIKAILFFGCPILAEGNMPWVITRLIELGLGNFVVVRNSFGVYELYDKNKHQKLVTTQKTGTNTVNEYVTAGMTYIGKPDDPTDFDNVQNINSIRLLSDLMKFDTGDTKKFDAAMAFLITLVGMRSFMGWRDGQRKRYRGDGDGTMKSIMDTLLDG